MHDERNKRGVLQQAEAAPLQRCARLGPNPFLALNPIVRFNKARSA
jgi:hypothetical protein